MAGIPVDELARVTRVLARRWPGCTVGRPAGSPFHEVKTADGLLIVAHEDIGEAIRLAVLIARDGKGSVPSAARRMGLGGGIGTRGGEG